MFVAQVKPSTSDRTQDRHGESALRIVTWNVRRARASSLVWDYLLETSPDIALLQEVGSIPDSVSSSYEVRVSHPINKRSRPQRFSSVLLVRGRFASPIELFVPSDWAMREVRRFGGNKKRAARELGVSFSTVKEKMRDRGEPALPE